MKTTWMILAAALATAMTCSAAAPAAAPAPEAKAGAKAESKAKACGVFRFELVAKASLVPAKGEGENPPAIKEYPPVTLVKADCVVAEGGNTVGVATLADGKRFTLQFTDLQFGPKAATFKGYQADLNFWVEELAGGKSRSWPAERHVRGEGRDSFPLDQAEPIVAMGAKDATYGRVAKNLEIIGYLTYVGPVPAVDLEAEAVVPVPAEVLAQMDADLKAMEKDAAQAAEPKKQP